MGWVVCSDAVVESCDAVLIFVVTASRCICDAVSSHCREILDQCWCRLEFLRDGLKDQVSKLESVCEDLRGEIKGEARMREEFMALQDTMALQDAEAQRIKKQNAELDARVVELNFDIADNGEEDDEKVKDENMSCSSTHQICLGVDLEPDEWIKDSGCSKHMTGNQKLFSTYKAYNGGNVIFGSNLRGNIIGKVVYGPSLGSHSSRSASIWSIILREVHVLKNNGFDFLSYCSKRVGDGNSTRFWLESWKGDKPFCVAFPRMFGLELNREIYVAAKMAAPLEETFRRPVRGGMEQHQFSELNSIYGSVSLSSCSDRWVCSLSSDGRFSVKEVRSAIDDLYLPSHSVPTRWVKVIPIKINIFAWRARRDCLPTRINLIQRGVSLDSSSCPICNSGEEDVDHVFFGCNLAQVVSRRLCRWWDLDWQNWSSFSEWFAWFNSIRLSSKVKSFAFDGVFLLLLGRSFGDAETRPF
ncbi:RNA-directed DNA polymerase, eukaryota [Tanacetum coccineum]